MCVHVCFFTTCRAPSGFSWFAAVRTARLVAFDIILEKLADHVCCSQKKALSKIYFISICNRSIKLLKNNYFYIIVGERRPHHVHEHIHEAYWVSEHDPDGPGSFRLLILCCA